MKPTKNLSLSILAFVLFCIAGSSVVHAQDATSNDWPMVAANPERTSWTPEEVRGDLQPEWYTTIEPYVHHKIQVIAAEDKVFVSTARGLYAFDAENGAHLWTYGTDLPLGHSPTYADGVLTSAATIAESTRSTRQTAASRAAGPLPRQGPGTRPIRW